MVWIRLRPRITEFSQLVSQPDTTCETGTVRRSTGSTPGVTHLVDVAAFFLRRAHGWATGEYRRDKGRR